MSLPEDYKGKYGSLFPHHVFTVHYDAILEYTIVCKQY